MSQHGQRRGTLGTAGRPRSGDEARGRGAAVAAAPPTFPLGGEPVAVGEPPKPSKGLGVLAAAGGSAAGGAAAGGTRGGVVDSLRRKLGRLARAESRDEGPFAAQIRQVLRLIGRAPLKWLYDTGEGEDRPGGVRRARMLALMAGTGTLTADALTLLVTRLQFLVNRELARRAKRGRAIQAEFLDALSVVPFFRRTGPMSVTVDPERLADLYPGKRAVPDGTGGAAAGANIAPGRQFPAVSVSSRGNRVHLGVDVDLSLLGDPSGEAARRALEIVRAAIEIEVFRLRAVQEGCTELVLELTREEGDALRKAFERGDLRDAGVLAVRELPAPRRDGLARYLWVDGPEIDPRAANAEALLADVWRRAVWREVLTRPLRRLRWLFSRSVRFSPIAHVIEESDRDAYAVARASGRRAPRRGARAAEAISGAAWPLLTAVLLVVTLTALRLLDPSVPVGVGVAAGLALSIAGAQVCACVVSPLAVGAGGIGMAWAFGVAHAVVVARFGTAGPLGRESIRQDPFTAVTGGAIGLSAPAWPGALPPGVIAGLLLAIPAAIATTGWLMAQPANAGGAAVPGRWREIAGAAAGSLAGAGIGLVYALTAALGSLGMGGPAAFAIAFAAVGGTAFGAAVWLKTGTVRKAAAFAALLAGVALALFGGAFALAGGASGLVLLAAATGLYHATWFTAAFVVGQRIGSRRAAVAATTIEGAVGFTAFVLWRLLHG
jgi:hypothetical protein